MHFSIPDTSTNAQSVTLFHVHINGIHHCNLRYSQLRTFNDELHRLFPMAMNVVEAFPPKKLFSLTSKDIDERRSSLESYLQSIERNKYLITSAYLNEFFLNSQRETFSSDSLNDNQKIDLNICLLNNHEIIIENVSPNANTTDLLGACANKMQLQKDILHFFNLFLYEQKENQLNIVRPLFDFESPYLSLKRIKKDNPEYCIVFRKNYWDISFDLRLIDDRRTRNLLFVQAQYEIEQSQNLYSGDIYQQLDILRDNKSFKDYILLARTSKFYGHIIIKQCSIVYPQEENPEKTPLQCLLAIGNNEIICCLDRKDKKKNKELNFKITRIRCWKMNWLKSSQNIALEYLMKKDTLEWITIYTEKASLIGVILQSMVDELIAKKKETSNPITNDPVTTTDVTVPKTSNGLLKRTESDIERLNNNDVFDHGGNDDDL